MVSGQIFCKLIMGIRGIVSLLIKLAGRIAQWFIITEARAQLRSILKRDIHFRD